MSDKLYVTIPYIIKEEAKKLNAKFDTIKKSWYVTSKEEKDLFELVKVDVKYELKDIVKSKGAIWDKDKKAWMTCKFNVDNINKLINNQNINTLVNKKNELMNNPEVKLINDISNIESAIKESNKMSFPKW